MPTSTRRLLWSLAALLVALVITSAFALQRRAAAAWQAMEDEVAALRTEVAARPGERAPLWGEPGPGNAYEHYERAVALLPVEPNQASALEEEATDATAMPSDAQRASWQDVLRALRAGAAAQDVTRPLPDERADPAESLLGWQAVARCARLEARALRTAGDDVEAARRVLDAVTFAGDLMRDATLLEQLIGISVCETATGDLDDTALAALDRAALDLLADGLRRFDDALAPIPELRVELLFATAQLHGAANALPRLAAWRYAFSTRWMVADAWTTMAEHVRGLDADVDEPWPAREARLERRLATVLDGGNVLVRIWMPNVTATERQWREARAHLRLLRMAIDLHRGVEAPPLRDPIGGGPIDVAVDGDGVRLSCAAAGDGEAPVRRVVR